jgi:hypothetical protein
VTETFASLSDASQVLVGEKLSSVTFVLDYWQLAFDGHVLSVFTSISVHADQHEFDSGANGFRDGLCGQIGKVVHAADYIENVFQVRFEDGSEIRAYARDSDYKGPEALTFQSYKFKTLYVV